jgi:hypothetical protein
VLLRAKSSNITHVVLGSQASVPVASLPRAICRQALRALTIVALAMFARVAAKVSGVLSCSSSPTLHCLEWKKVQI